MAASLEGVHRIVGMAVRIGGDAGKVRFLVAQCVLERTTDLVTRQPAGQRHVRTVDEGRNLEARIVVVGQRVAAAHIAQAGNDNAEGFGRSHFDVLCRVSLLLL